MTDARKTLRRIRSIVITGPLQEPDASPWSASSSFSTARGLDSAEASGRVVEEHTCPPRERSLGKSTAQAIKGAEHSGLDSARINGILASACAFPDDPGFEQAVGNANQGFGQSREDAIESFVLRAPRSSSS